MSDTLVQNGTVTQQKDKEQGQARPVSQRRVTFTPQVDILELPEALVLQIDMPGVKTDGVEVRFERGELVVVGRREPTPRPAGRSLVEEFEPGDYYRAFLISQDVAGDEITAELKNGVLTINLPKSKASLPRRVTVKGT